MSKFQESQLKINKIVHKPYQEIYEIVRDDKTARISIYYNKEGIFKKPSLQKSDDSQTELIEQKDKVNNNDNYPCPYTVGVFKLLKAYKKPNLNLNKIQEWIVKLNPDKLSRRGTQST